jgi:hypothetical protein
MIEHIFSERRLAYQYLYADTLVTILLHYYLFFQEQKKPFFAFFYDAGKCVIWREADLQMT